MYGKRWVPALLALCLQASAAGPADAATGAVGPRPVVERSFVIVLDPGHGGSNRGCVGFDGHAREKEVTLALALQLQRTLGDRMPEAQIVLTREADRTLTLAERVAMANAREADLFISLHANASESRAQHGYETYILDARASTLEAARTARRENDALLAEPVPTEGQPEVATMLRQLALTADRAAAARLAHGIQREQSERFPERVDRGVKQAPFDVLMGARMPAILFEAGFLDHPTEGPLLLDPTARARMADGLVEAIIEHYRSVGR